MLRTGFQLLTCQTWHLDRWDIQQLRAPFDRIYFNLDDGAWLRFAGRKVPLLRNHFYYLAAETECSSGLDARVRHGFIHFFKEGLGPKQVAGFHELSLGEHLARLAAPVFESLLDHSLEDGNAAPFAAGLVGCALAACGIGASLESPGHPAVEKVIAKLDAMNYPPLDNSALARIGGMNVNAFIRVFTSDRGISPQAWLRARRIDQACHMLAHTTLSIDEISERLGFANRFHFTATFRKVRGSAPATWRNTTLSNPQRMRSSAPDRNIVWSQGR
ncbi:MAG: helix-turn-helix transcriptional regulator [Verrucomicrobiae bacterium]|nr:helix-turn-helix transcriptional regulator [Verrucomicrobiae bacterium]